MKPPGLSLDSYLAQEAREGAWESEGVFTISGEAALGKLAAFQLPRRSAWILKIVQCAVALQATSLAVKQTRKATYFNFASELPFDVESLTPALATLGAKERYLTHLGVGLRAVGFGERRPFELSIRQSATLESFRWDGRDFHRERSRISEDGGCKIALRVDSPPVEERRGLRGRLPWPTCEESEELIQRAEACPIPLTLDGRRLDTLEGSRPLDLRKVRVTQLGLCWYAPEDSQHPSLRLPRGVNRHPPKAPFSDSVDSGPMLCDGDPKRFEAESILKLGYAHNVTSWLTGSQRFGFEHRLRNSYLHWVADGVTCRSESLSWGGQAVVMDLYLPAQDLDTDLTGLAFLTESQPERHRRVRTALEHADGSLAKLEETLDQPSLKPVLLTVAQVGFGLAMGVLLPGPGTVAGAGLGLSAAFALRAEKKHREDCRLSLERLRKLVLAEREHFSSSL